MNWSEAIIIELVMTACKGGGARAPAKHIGRTVAAMEIHRYVSALEQYAMPMAVSSIAMAEWEEKDVS